MPTLIELNNIAKEGDRAVLDYEGAEPFIDARVKLPLCMGIPITNIKDDRALTAKQTFSNKWRLIPRAKECFVNVYEYTGRKMLTASGELRLGGEYSSREGAIAQRESQKDCLGTLHITYDGTLNVKVVK